VGYMDLVSGLLNENDLETCREKRPEIVREIGPISPISPL